MKKIFLLLFCSIISLSLKAQKVVHLEGDFIQVLPDNSYTLIDSALGLEVPMLSPKVLEDRDTLVWYNQNREFAYWRVLTLHNSSANNLWFLEFPDPHISRIQVYEREQGTVLKYKAAGFDTSFNQRYLHHKNFVFPVVLPQGATKTMYVRIWSSRYSGIHPNLRSAQNLFHYFFSEYYLLGIYYGVILILLVYNFVLGIRLKDKVHFWYCLFLVFCGLHTFTDDGIGFQYLWPELPYVNSVLEHAVPLLLLLSFYLYSNSFIALRKGFPIPTKATLASILMYVLSLAVFQESILTWYLYLLCYIVLFYSALTIFFQGYKAGRFFIAGNALVVFSIVIFILRIQGFLDSTIFTVYIFNFCFFIDAVVFSIAIADKVKIERETKELAQKQVISQLKINAALSEKVNTELEAKVHQRTKELHEQKELLAHKNTELEKLKIQLYEMNSVMDKNIWELNKSIKSKIHEQILDTHVSFEEFQKVFTEDQCIVYLKELKWGNGFKCVRCGNEKAGKGTAWNLMKCTTCMHQESITANTIFHGLRFPISVAFYLTYLFLQNKNEATLEELGKKLNLGKNTIWNFSKRVKEKKKTLKGIKGKNELWEKMIL